MANTTKKPPSMDDVLKGISGNPSGDSPATEPETTPDPVTAEPETTPESTKAEASKKAIFLESVHASVTFQGYTLRFPQLVSARQCPRAVADELVALLPDEYRLVEDDLE